ncbi:MAG: hypothetical protein ACRD1M_17695 [Terriglobales bacterium]
MHIRRWWLVLIILGLGALPGWSQAPVRYTFLGGALLGTPSGFAVGAGLTFNINRNVSFDPGIAVGRSGDTGLFTASGVFRYEFHPDNEAVIPYILGGVGLSQWGSATHGSAIGGVGARFPIGHGTWIVPEVRLADHGLARFTIGISKSF